MQHYNLARHFARFLVDGVAIALVCAIATTTPAVAQWSVALHNSIELDGSAIGSFGELSGVTYLGEAGGNSRFAAVQDNGAGVVVFDVSLSANASITGAVGVSTLALADAFDFEGVAFTGTARNSLLVSYEDDPGSPGILPGVREYDLTDGSLLQSVALPAPWTTNGNTRGNRGFESLTLSSDGTTLWTANEEALTIDGPLASQSGGTVVRLQSFDHNQHSVVATSQYAYHVESIHGPTNSSARSGLSDLIALPDGNLLALERSAALTLPGFLSRIYQIDFFGGADVSQSPLDAGLAEAIYTPVGKSPIFSGGVGGLLGSNLEGLALGPRLASGNWSLVGVVDNGGGSTGNLIVGFELIPPTCNLPGDYNCSGEVDPFDYQTWRSTFGSTMLLFADGNGDGRVDAADYTVWRDNLGASNVIEFESVGVPEPNSVWLATTVVAAANCRRVRRTLSVFELRR